MIEYEEIPQPTIKRWKVDTKNKMIWAVARKDKAVRKAEKDRRIAIAKLKDELKEIVGPLGPEEFWKEMELFQKHIKMFRDELKRSDWSEDATNEYFRDKCVLVGPNSGFIEGDNDNANQFGVCVQCCRFVWRYDEMVALISSKARGAEWSDGCGPDSFGDICDSFLLRGEEAYNKALLQGKWPKDVFDGENENYISSNLGKAMDFWLAVCCRDLLIHELGDDE